MLVPLLFLFSFQVLSYFCDLPAILGPVPAPRRQILFICQAAQLVLIPSSSPERFLFNPYQGPLYLAGGCLATLLGLESLLSVPLEAGRVEGRGEISFPA